MTPQRSATSSRLHKPESCKFFYGNSAMYCAVIHEPGRTSIIEHTIDMEDARPIRFAPYHLPHAYREVIHQELQEMEQAGAIEPSSSLWAAPIVLVKKDGSLRLCVDYRRLNAASRTDIYPMPRIDDLVDQLERAQFITTLDLSLASHPYFSSCACAEERGRGKGRKNTSGKMCKVFVPSARMLAEPIKFEHSK